MASYFDAADQVGLSRIWGGIHPPADDLTGRRVGAEVGRTAWELARRFYDGSVLNSEVNSVPARSMTETSKSVSTRCDFIISPVSSAKVEGPDSDGGIGGQVAHEALVTSTNVLGEAPVLRWSTSRDLACLPVRRRHLRRRWAKDL